MGLNVGLNTITTGGLFLATIFIVIMGILLVSAEKKIKDIPEYTQSSDLQDGRSALQTAYILTFIAAGVALVLSIVYMGQEIWWCPPEWIHMIFFLIIVVLLVVASIYAYDVLEGIYDPRLADRVGTDNYIWAALLFAVVSFVTVFMVGSGRAGYGLVRNKMGERVSELERTIYESYSSLTGEPVDYEKIGIVKSSVSSGKGESMKGCGKGGHKGKPGCGPPPYERHRKVEAPACPPQKYQCPPRATYQSYQAPQPLVGPPPVMARQCPI